MRYRHFYTAGIMFSLGLAVVGLVLDKPGRILSGMWTILSSQDVLITDYMALAGPGAAFCNAALVTLAALGIMALAKDPVNGYTLVDVGLMAGFALFGKNILNIWPIILGTWLFALVRREPFKRVSSVALLATSLSPLVSFAGLNTGWDNPVLGICLGVLVGFVVVPLSSYTYRIQNGMNLYNMGFACGLLATVIVPLMDAMNKAPRRANYWATGYDLPLGIVVLVLCAALIVGALICEGKGAMQGYLRLLRTTGRSPSDYLVRFGPGPTLLNMGVNGLICLFFIVGTGGDLNGPTVGCMFTVIGFSAYGKHARNIVPVIAGVLLGSLVMRFSINDPAVQMAALLCTTLAPISGCFGWPFGVIAGFLHSALVLKAGTVAEGINLYNNGFSGGLLAIVLYPVVTSLAMRAKPHLQDEEYLDQFQLERIERKEHPQNISRR